MNNGLTSFRFVSALVVFLFHCYSSFEINIGVRFIDRAIAHGSTFMTGFFVLSGFVMAYVYNETDFTKAESIYNFYKKRFAKIYPTYAIATIAFFLIFRNFSFWELSRVVVNDLFLVQGFFPSMFSIGLNGGTWSLTVEMFLYFLFPFLIVISGRSPKILIVAAILVALVSFNSTSDILYSNPIFRVPDFLFGMGFYFLTKKIRFNLYTHIASIILLLLVMRGVAGMKGQYLSAPLFGVWISAIYFSRSKIYDNPVFVYLGKISYSFYLWQFLAIGFGKKFIEWYPSYNGGLVVLGTFFVNVLLSTISYYMIEERFRILILKLEWNFFRKLHQSRNSS